MPSQEQLIRFKYHFCIVRSMNGLYHQNNRNYLIQVNCRLCTYIVIAATGYGYKDIRFKRCTFSRYCTYWLFYTQA